MLWLIQRDFLEGKTVQDMVSEALLPVANPYDDQDIAQVSLGLQAHVTLNDRSDVCSSACLFCFC